MSKPLQELQKLQQYPTDKNSRHFYLEIYDQFFKKYQYADNLHSLLEIGVAKGGSMALWNSYFSDVRLIGLDLHDEREIRIVHSDFIKRSAYTTETIKALRSEYGTFSIIIDDGSHNLDDQKFVIREYSNLITTGLLIVEDVVRSAVPHIIEEIYRLPRKYRLSLYDRTTARNVTHPEDDVIVVIEFV